MLYLYLTELHLNTNNLEYLDNCIDYFEDKEKIIIAVDSDEAGQALQSELVRRLGSETCYLASFDDCKDANEYLIKIWQRRFGKSVLPEQDRYHSKMSRRSKMLKTKSRTLFETVLNLVFKWVWRILIGSFLLILGSSLLSLGIPSSGKSDFVDQMTVIGYNQNYGWKTAYASPENQPTYLHAHKLMRKVWQDMPTVDEIHTDKWNQIADHVNSNFFFIDMERYTSRCCLTQRR